MIYAQLIYNLTHNINFSFSRWGDGEWTALLGLKPSHKSNCDGHQYFEDMGRELRAIVESKPSYYMGLQPLAQRIMGDKIAPHLDGIDWCNADILHNASAAGELGRFMAILEERPVLYVGSNYNIGIMLNASFVPIPAVNCWLAVDNAFDKIRGRLKERRGVVVLFSASMAANVMIDRLFNEYGTQHTFIDVGSVFDPYVGNATRKYHQQIIDREHSRSNKIS